MKKNKLIATLSSLVVLSATVSTITTACERNDNKNPETEITITATKTSGQSFFATIYELYLLKNCKNFLTKNTFF